MLLLLCHILYILMNQLLNILAVHCQYGKVPKSNAVHSAHCFLRLGISVKLCLCNFFDIWVNAYVFDCPLALALKTGI